MTSAAVATSDPRATDIAVGVLRDGGNAVDAAVTAAYALGVIEPQSCGVGGDAFLITTEAGGPPQALDGAGRVPAGLSDEQLAADGFTRVPATGAGSVTVPGSVSLFEAALAAHGTISLADAVGPAIALARDGYEARPTLVDAVGRAVDGLAADPVLGPLFVPGGTPIALGQRIFNPRLAECLEIVARDGAKAFYEGELAAAIVDRVASAGGYLTADDLARHRTEPVTLETTTFRGTTVWELPLPTQGPAVLRALDALTDRWGDGCGDGDEVDWAVIVDAVRDGMVQIGFDPAAVPVARPDPTKGDTTYLAVVDGDGRAASLITSVFGDFGARLGVEALGGPLHNRAAMFVLLSRPVSQGKPPHTIIPAIVTSPSGELRWAMGVAGGPVQPQVQVQLLVRMLCEGMAPQEAIDAPRFKLMFGGDLAIEPEHPLRAVDPEAVGRKGGPRGYGAAQVAGYHDGRLHAGADARRGGAAAVVELT